MRANELQSHRPLRPHKLPAGDVPHLVIEPNKTCNIRCNDCYSRDWGHIKSYEQVVAEIDLGLRRRKLESISLLGGEPTLHPRIVDIVSYIKSRGVVCLLLTNGVTFLEDEDDQLLKDLIAAGLDRVMVHIDRGQSHVHQDLDLARRRVFDKLEKHRIFFGVSATVRAGDEQRFPRLLSDHNRYRYFDGILATLAVDMDSFHEQPDQELEASMCDVCQAIDDQLGVAPTTYIPTSLDDDEVAWVMYMYYVNARTGAAFAISPQLANASRDLYRRVAGRHAFAATTPTSLTPVFAGLSGAMDVAIRPSRTAELGRFLKGLRRPSDLRFQYIVLQRSPRLDPQRGAVGICYHCPDATVRNGRITPVCIADQLSPLDGSGARIPEAYVEAIWEHLEEGGQPLVALLSE